MRNPATTVSVLTGVTMLIGMSEGADAAVISQTQEFSASDNSISIQSGNPDQAFGTFAAGDSLGFEAFDSNLGTLTDVQFSWTSETSIDVDADVTVIPSETGEISVALSSEGTFVIDIGSLTAAELTDTHESSDADNCTAEGSDEGCSVAVDTFSIYSDSIEALDLAAFQEPGGSSNVGVGFSLQGVANLVATGAVDDLDFPATIAAAQWAGEFTVQYTFDPTPTAVPEPGTLGLVGIGLVGLGAVAVGGRRRKA